MRRMLHRWQTRSWILNVPYISQCSIATSEFYSHKNRRYCARETGNAVKHVQHWRHGRVRSPHRRRGQKRPGEQSGSREGGGRAHVHIPQGRLVRLHQPGPGPLVAGRLAGGAHRHWRQRGGCVRWVRQRSATGQRSLHWKPGIELKTAEASNNEGENEVRLGVWMSPWVEETIRKDRWQPKVTSFSTRGLESILYWLNKSMLGRRWAQHRLSSRRHGHTSETVKDQSHNATWQLHLHLLQGLRRVKVS